MDNEILVTLDDSFLKLEKRLAEERISECSSIYKRRFWKYVTITDSCWLWKGAKNTGGYGQFGIRTPEGFYKMVLAHKFSWELLNGPVPYKLLICHNCPEGDNPACVNPAHMFLGTHTDNRRDYYKKNPPPPKERRKFIPKKKGVYEIPSPQKNSSPTYYFHRLANLVETIQSLDEALLQKVSKLS